MRSGEIHLGQLMLHWVVAHATAAGTMAAVNAPLEFVESPLGVGQPGGVLLSIVVLLLLFKAQELILRAARLAAPYWVVQSFLAALAAWFAGLVAGWWVLFIENPDMVITILATLVGTVACGAFFGWFQVLGVFASWREHLVWIAVHAIVTFAVVYSLLLAEGLRIRSPLILGTIAGATYGLLTGCCLKWALTRLPAAARSNPES